VDRPPVKAQQQAVSKTVIHGHAISFLAREQNPRRPSLSLQKRGQSRNSMRPVGQHLPPAPGVIGLPEAGKNPISSLAAAIPSE
jgi:hypothetical protein